MKLNHDAAGGKRCAPSRTGKERILAIARDRGTLTRRDVVRAGIHTQTLTALVREGALERVGRRIYRLSRRAHHRAPWARARRGRGAPRDRLPPVGPVVSRHRNAALVAGVAGHRSAGAPARRGLPPLRIFRFSGEALRHGVEVHRVEGVDVRVTSPARTIADLFKYRNKIGLDVAIEALREGWRERRFTIEELDRAARVCRVERVMRPYVETVLS